ncbi:MAG: aspartate aminotransferase family protein [Sulfobacillus acidophilus]|uniref:Glutamate-1-semialdehyde 2,1-aminomutase n=1 Tax=Sulfobacillus acidophilus TaxID=53633 RepID=A0A2T2WH68_9FIRM|nr:MAG: aspartate aminotransferase family protein [Sulfobacillus acidophilus]
MKHNGSREWFDRAQTVIAGGVNSPARSFAAVGGNPPVVVQKGEGAYLVDVDGNRYIDYLAAFGPLVLGHSHPHVVEAGVRALAEGSLTGTPHPTEILLAEELCRSIAGLQEVRLTTTGTEAVMSLIRLARAYTGRNRVIKFDGSYHGHSDAVLVRAGSGASTAGAGDSLGIPPGVMHDVISLPFNDLEALRNTLTQIGHEVALVLTEPIVGNMGIVHPEPGYLQAMAAMTHEAGALLGFDEVITAYRFHYGSAGALLGVIPDLYALGKIIGGGLPAGAYGGRAEIMALVSPLGGMFQAGTLAGNPLSSATGLATLEVLRTTNPYPRMDELARVLETEILLSADRHGIDVSINRAGSGFTLFFGVDEVKDYRAAQKADSTQFAAFHRLMLEQGVYLAPSRFEAWFVSAAHQATEIERTISAVDYAFSRLRG